MNTLAVAPTRTSQHPSCFSGCLSPCHKSSNSCLNRISKYFSSYCNSNTEAVVPISRNPKRPLRVIKLDNTEINRLELIKILTIWSEISLEKKITANNKSFRKDKTLFADSNYVSKTITESLEDNILNHQDYRIFLCKDVESEQIEGIAITEDRTMKSTSPTLFICYMMTHPKNLRTKINQFEYTIVEGVGSSLIKYLIELAKTENKAKLSLTPIPNSGGFYKKQGFGNKGSTDCDFINLSIILRT